MISMALLVRLLAVLDETPHGGQLNQHAPADLYSLKFSFPNQPPNRPRAESRHLCRFLNAQQLKRVHNVPSFSMLDYIVQRKYSVTAVTGQ
jgi:hypothetical protein